MLGCFGWLIYVLQNINDVGIGWQVPAFCLTMFVACMVCHGELYALKPHPRWLTSFYLMISLGGAIGGFLTHASAYAMNILVGGPLMVLGALLGLIAISFGIWGIGDIFRSHGPSDAVAEVGKTKIENH